MDSHHIVQLLGILAIILAAARLLGSAARAIGQPAVLGELLAGVVLGASVLGLINLGDDHEPQTPVFHFLQEVGVVILLFEIGLETDLVQLLRAGASSTAVAIAGVVLPFAGGYLVCHYFGLGDTEASWPARRSRPRASALPPACSTILAGCTSRKARSCWAPR